MHPLKITLPGDYWDCWLYRGRLYLWTMDGTLVVLNWDHIISGLPKSESDALALTCAFSKGDYLYGDKWNLLFGDPDVKDLVQRKFRSVARHVLILSEMEVREAEVGRQENPFRELPTDIHMMSNQVLAATDSGVWRATAHRPLSTKYPVSSKPVRLWDCPVFSLDASRGRVAVAAGEEGLFEAGLSSGRLVVPEWRPEGDMDPPDLPPTPFIEREPVTFLRVHGLHASAASWAGASIYSSSSLSGACMAVFRLAADGGNQPRTFDRLVEQEAIFTNAGISWGAEDKLYCASENSIEVTRYAQPWDDHPDRELFTALGTIAFDAWKGSVVGGGVATFGTIVELENALVVIGSDNTTHTIPGPVTRWRVYPRSISYQNHLHVIRNDCIDIYSFNHDYFMEQKEKLAGAVWAPPPRQRSRARLFAQ